MSRTIKDMPAVVRAAERNRKELPSGATQKFSGLGVFASREEVEDFFARRDEVVGEMTEEDYGAPNNTSFYAKRANRRNRHQTKQALRSMDLEALEDLCLDGEPSQARWLAS